MWDMITEFFGGITDFWGGVFNGLLDWIIELINGFVGGIADIILSWLESSGLSIEIPPSVFDILRELSIGVGYIFPVRALLPIPMIMISFYVLKLVFAVYKIIASTIIRRVSVKV